MATKLGLYNGALRILKERRIASLSEDREPKRLLDDVYSDGTTEGAVIACLEMGQWTFATRSVQIDYSPSITPAFGYRYAFDRPTDLVRVCGIWSDDRMTSPLLQYRDERHYWYCDLQTIYVAYVSKNASYGIDLSLWPESFTSMVEAYLAKEIAPNLTNGDDKIAIAEKKFDEALKEASSRDAMNMPTKFAPPGTWTTSRGISRHGSRWNGSFA
jgi:hypothetical protein